MIKQDIPEAPITPSVELNKQIQDIMNVVRETYSEQDSYKTIMMNLTNISKELNTIRVYEIYPEGKNNGKTD